MTGFIDKIIPDGTPVQKSVMRGEIRQAIAPLSTSPAST